MNATEAGSQPRTKRWKVIVACLVLIALAGGLWGWKEGRPWYYGIQTYLYGFPLIMMDLTKDQGTAVPTAGEITAPINQFSVMTKYPDATFRAVVRTGLDTLFACAWADLDKEPLVLSVPDTKRALLRDRVIRHVEQRLHVDRQAHHRHRRGELPDRRARLAGHGAGQCQTGLRVADAVRVGQRPDAGRRAEGLCGSEHAPEAVQADAALRLGPAVYPACRPCRYLRASTRRRRPPNR